MVKQKIGKLSVKQGGVSILLFMVTIVLIGLSSILYLLNSNSIKTQRTNKTYAALSEAKTALIGFAVLNASKPGTLPCTDSSNTGSAVSSGTNACVNYIGRLPWKQLGTSMLKDANGECLWYALSPIFRNQMTTAKRKLNPLNSFTNGTINVVNDLDVPIVSGNPIIALVIAPSLPVSGQNRSGAATTYCPGDSVASSYLDTKGAVNNATGNNVAGVNYTFKKGVSDNSFNDEIIYITAKDLYPSLRKRITKEIVGNPSPIAVPSGLVKYFQTVIAPPNTYPCPAKSIMGNADCALPLGNKVPYNDATRPLQYTALGSWLEDNGWFAMTTYTYVSSTHVKVTVSDSLGSYTCNVSMNVVSCSSP